MLNFVFMQTIRNILTLSAALLFLVSCRQTNPFTGQKPTAIGKPNDIDIVMDSTLAQQGIWDTLDYYYASSYPVMPAPEPFFDLRHLTPEDLENDAYKKELKTLLFVADISDTNSVTTRMVRADFGPEKWKQAMEDPAFTLVMAKDKWAKDQLLIYIFARGTDRLAEAIRQHFPAVATRVNKHDAPAIEASLYGSKGQNIELSELIKTKYGIQLNVPPSFVKALEEENFLWIRMDDKKSIQNFVIQKFPYTDTSQFSVNSLITLRDTYGKQYIETNSEGAYMRTNPVDLPVYEYSLNVQGLYGKEYRGIWETVNDFMGGPFFSYLILTPDQKEIIFIDAFVLAPGEDKRDMMQKLDHVVKNGRF